MYLHTFPSLKIAEGVGQLQFPPAFKKDPLHSNIQCKSLCFLESEEVFDEPLFVVCNASLYYTQDREVNWNVMGMYKPKWWAAQMVTFDHMVPITIPKETITVEIVNFDGKRQNVSATGLFCFEGIINNQLWV